MQCWYLNLNLNSKEYLQLTLSWKEDSSSYTEFIRFGFNGKEENGLCKQPICCWVTLFKGERGSKVLKETLDICDLEWDTQCSIPIPASWQCPGLDLWYYLEFFSEAILVLPKLVPSAAGNWKVDIKLSNVEGTLLVQARGKFVMAPRASMEMLPSNSTQLSHGPG